MANGILKAPYYIEVTTDTVLTAVEGTVYHVKNTGTGLKKITYGSGIAYINDDETIILSYIGSAWNIIDYKLSSDRTVNIPASSGEAAIQALIDAQPKQLGGYAITFNVLGNCTIVSSGITINDFSCGEVILQSDNSTDRTTNTASKNVNIFSLTNDISILAIANCTSAVKILGLKFQTNSVTSGTSVVFTTRSNNVKFQYCTIESSGPNGQFLFDDFSVAYVTQCYLYLLNNAIYASGASLVFLNGITYSSVTTENVSIFTSRINTDVSPATYSTASGGKISYPTGFRG